MNNSFTSLPPVVKNLLFINAGFFIMDLIFENFFKINLSGILGLHYYKSTEFRPLQIVTHMFMHGNLMHIFFNMFAVYMFGQVLEKVWGGKRFLIYYLVTGFGAAFLHTLVNYIQVQYLINQMDPTLVATVFNEGNSVLELGKNYMDVQAGKLNLLVNTPVVGASGAVFGLLLGFGMLFPNTPLMLMFIPIPIKAKYFVAGYAAIELFSGIANRPGDNVAHFAHLGGLIFGFILIKIWQKDTKKFF